MTNFSPFSSMCHCAVIQIKDRRPKVPIAKRHPNMIPFFPPASTPSSTEKSDANSTLCISRRRSFIELRVVICPLNLTNPSYLEQGEATAWHPGLAQRPNSCTDLIEATTGACTTDLLGPSQYLSHCCPSLCALPRRNSDTNCSNSHRVMK